MLVRYWMTKNPISIPPDTSISQAFDLMNSKKIRRLLVIENEKLLGILTKHQIMCFVPDGIPVEKVESDSPFDDEEDEEDEKSKKETPHSSLLVKQVMARDPVCCQLNTTLEEVGAIMRDKKIAALPVTEKDKVVGIITESDVLNALVKITTTDKESRRVCFTFDTSRKKEIFAEVVGLAEKYQIEIHNMFTHFLPAESNFLALIRFEGDQEEEFITSLRKKHPRFLSIL